MNPPKDTPYSLEYGFSLLGDIRGKTVLDYGCGSGRIAVVLRARGARLLALDISPHLLEVAHKRLATHGLEADTEFLLATGHRMPIPDGSVDIVFGVAILHHLNLTEASQEVRRVLRPGGVAIFIEPVRDSRLYRALRRIFPNRSEDISPFEYPLTQAQLHDFRREFQDGPRRRFQFPGTTILERLGVPESVVRKSRQLDRFLLQLMPQLGPWATIEVFQVSRPAEPGRSADGAPTMSPRAGGA
ncbi:MAG: class I SAM-dependent methyltransferase [Gemmatimonadales bacterium]